MDTLFNQKFQIPLAEKYRPKKINDFVGQMHLLDNDKIIKSMINNNTPLSIILWGPPGCGKTTLAHILSDSMDMDSYFLSAISSGIADVKKVIKKGKENRILSVKTMLFLDEIHRFNKAQQDSVLGAVENGDIVLIGATTENPSFSIISPLLSRTRVLKFNPLENNELEEILYKFLKNDDFGKILKLKEDIKKKIIDYSSGDARRLFNIIESSIELCKNNEITEDMLEQVLSSLPSYYDRQGEKHYDSISAFIKSVRGSDPDAAVFYLAKMINGGEDPEFIARRMIILASEDIGNASPNALNMAVSTLTAVKNIGMPESRIILSQCAIYLACSPKSNASYKAIDSAIEIDKSRKTTIPLKIRNAPTKQMKDFNYGKGYKYAHDFENNFVQDDFLPEEIRNIQFYNPTNNGTENAISEHLKKIWKNKKNYN